jgi:Undecaprenyl-phosphate glucose phosphotransferase
MNFVKPEGNVASASAETFRPLLPQRKWPISYRSVGAIAIASDIVIILFSGVLSGILYNVEAFGGPGDIIRYLGSAAVVAALFVTVMKGRDMYSPAELVSLRSQLRMTTTTWLSTFLFLSGAVFALKIGDHFSRGAIFSFAVLGGVLLIVERAVCREVLIRGLNQQKFSARNAILITDENAAARTGMVPTLLKHGFQPAHHFVLPELEQQSQQQEDFLADVIGYLRGSDIEEIVVCADVKRWGDLNRLLTELRTLPLPVSLIPMGTASEILSRPSRVVDDSLCIELQRGPLDTFERGVKRLIDVIGALGALLLLVPLLTVIAVLIKLDSPGPILFRQRRCGFNGRQFDIFKFRTMSVLEDGPVVSQASQSDSRVTRLGKLLRRTSIDELPQLLNVLSGSMALVGPRPHAVAHDNHFYKVVRKYAFRHHVKPGLTGWAQVHGCRGPTPTLADIGRRVEFDLWYIDNWSLRLDFLIFVRTALEIMRGRNAY